MIFYLITTLLIWLLVLAIWIFVSTFVHELFHLLVAWVAGFRIYEYRLYSIPGGPKGFVDVIIPKGTQQYYLKKGCLHLAGIFAHLLIATGCMYLILSVQGLIIRGVLVIGLLVNLYLLIFNIFPRHSDGRQFWDMLDTRSRLIALKKQGN